MRKHNLLAVTTLMILGLLILTPMSLLAQDEDEEALGWSNETDLSLVVTEGNSSTDTFGFKNLLRRNWKKARYTFRIDAVRSNTADDPIAVINPGQGPEDYEIVTFDKSPDVENYFVENRYDRSITEKFFWNAGLTWDRNKDAGILSRWIFFAGVGNIWWDRDDLKFNTSYGLSYTSREEEDEDPEKDDTFPGFRFNWEYENKWGKVTTFTNDWVVNYNFSNSTDWNTDMISAITMDINTRLAFRVSLRWIYNNLPALEDIDLFLRTPEGDLIGLPETVQEPKEKLDTIFRTSLVVKVTLSAPAMRPLTSMKISVSARGSRDSMS